MIGKVPFNLLVMFILYFLTFQEADCAEFDYSIFGKLMRQRNRLRRDDESVMDDIAEMRMFNAKLENVQEFPYIASVYQRGSVGDKLKQVLCTGILLNKNHVLTTAKCVIDYPTEIEVRLGSEKSDEGGHTRNVSKLFVHPEFKSGDIGLSSSIHNVALLELDSPIAEGAGILYANISSPEDEPEHTMDDLIERTASCKSAGFGVSSLHKEDAGILRAINLTLFPSDECSNVYSGDIEKTAQVCASIPSIPTNDSAGLCFYDDGGPLSCEGKVYGIFTYMQISKDCGQLPHTFIRLDFISSFLSKPPTTAYKLTETPIPTTLTEETPGLKPLDFPKYPKAPVTSRPELEEKPTLAPYQICQALRVATLNNPCPAPCGIPPNSFI